MLRILLGKGLRMVILLGLVSLFSFILVAHSPIDPVDAYIGADMMLVGDAQKALIAEKWGLDRPLHVRFLSWAGQVVVGDLGHSTVYNEPVLRVIVKRFQSSLALMGAAWLLSGIIGFILGVVAGVWEGRGIDRCIRIYALTLASTPAFWLGIVLLMIFSVHLGWTPLCGAAPPGIAPESVTLGQRIHHLILPAMTLSIIGIAAITMHTREKVIEVMRSDYVLFSRAQGEGTWGVIVHHVLRNAAIPAITLQFASLGELFGGSVLAEQVFAYPGLGRATVAAGIRGDVPLLLGIVLFTTLFVSTGNAMADIFYRAVDPRIGRVQEVIHGH